MSSWSPIPPTRKQRVVNTGNAIEVVGGALEPVSTYSTSAPSEALSIYVQCTELEVPDNLVATADFRLMVQCDWGNGNASNKVDFDCTYRQRIPVVGASVEMFAWIAAFPPFDGGGRSPIGPFTQGGLGGPNGPLQAPNTVKARARVFIGGGTDAVSLFPTFWLTQQNLSSGVYLAGQGRLATFKFWVFQPTDDAPATDPVFLQLFDKGALPVATDVPFDSSPFVATTATADGEAQKVLVQGQTRALAAGLSWGLSSTPFDFTPIASNPPLAFTTAEFEE